MCLTPPPEFRRFLEKVSDMKVAAWPYERLKAKVEEQDEIANFAFVCRAGRIIGWNWPQ
jgi:hypothetical protein